MVISSSRNSSQFHVWGWQYYNCLYFTKLTVCPKKSYSCYFDDQATTLTFLLDTLFTTWVSSQLEHLTLPKTPAPVWTVANHPPVLWTVLGCRRMDMSWWGHPHWSSPPVSGAVVSVCPDLWCPTETDGDLCTSMSRSLKHNFRRTWNERQS